MKTIKKILTISALHVSENTIELLEKEIGDEQTENNLTYFFEIYKASEWGYILNFNGADNIPDILSHKDQIPKDLQKVLQYASENDCDMLQLDIDGEIISYLPVYDNDKFDIEEEDESDWNDYELTYYETYEKTYTVNARSYEEAKEELEDQIRNGFEDAPDQCADSGFREDEKKETKNKKWKGLEDDLRHLRDRLDYDLGNTCSFNEAERNIIFKVKSIVESILNCYFDEGVKNNENRNGK